MSNIFIDDLNLGGSSLFLATESFIDSMQDLSENELKMTIGGKNGKSKGSKTSKSKSGKSYSYSGCGCPCGGGNGGGSGGG